MKMAIRICCIIGLNVTELNGAECTWLMIYRLIFNILSGHKAKQEYYSSANKYFSFIKMLLAVGLFCTYQVIAKGLIFHSLQQLEP